MDWGYRDNPLPLVPSTLLCLVYFACNHANRSFWVISLQNQAGWTVWFTMGGWGGAEKQKSSPCSKRAWEILLQSKRIFDVTIRLPPCWVPVLTISFSFIFCSESFHVQMIKTIKLFIFLSMTIIWYSDTDLRGHPHFLVLKEAVPPIASHMKRFLENTWTPSCPPGICSILRGFSESEMTAPSLPCHLPFPDAISPGAREKLGGSFAFFLD